MNKILLFSILFITIIILGLYLIPKEEMIEVEDIDEIPEAYPSGVFVDGFTIHDNNTIYYHHDGIVYSYKVDSEKTKELFKLPIEDLSEIKRTILFDQDRFCISYNFQIDSPEEIATILKTFDYEGKQIDEKTSNLTVSPIECSEEIIVESAFPFLEYKQYIWKNDLEKIDTISTFSEYPIENEEFAETRCYDKLVVTKDFSGELWITVLEDFEGSE